MGLGLAVGVGAGVGLGVGSESANMSFWLTWTDASYQIHVPAAKAPCMARMVAISASAAADSNLGQPRPFRLAYQAWATAAALHRPKASTTPTTVAK